jgi:hypothetical protein
VNQLLLPEPDINTLMDRLIDAAVCWVKRTGYVCRLDRYTDNGCLSNVITKVGHSNAYRWDMSSGVFWCDTSCSGSTPDITINLSAGMDMIADMIDFLED